MSKKRGLFSKKETNWDKVKDKGPSRDVYSEQQLDRSEKTKMQGPWSRIALAMFIGIITFAVTYVAIGIVLYLSSGAMNSAMYGNSDIPPYYVEERILTDFDGIRSEYQTLDQNGNVASNAIYAELDEVPVPEWYRQMVEENAANSGSSASSLQTKLIRLFISFMLGLVVYSIMYQVLMRNLAAQNVMHDTSDINPYHDDVHIQLPEEIQSRYDWFPDVGAHSNVQVSSLISHMALSNKGLNKIKVPRRADVDIIDEDGDIVYYKGEMLLDDDGNPLMDEVPIIDEKFGDALFEASGADKVYWKKWNVKDVNYNKGNTSRDRLPGFDTVADLINNDWEMPLFEVQRPSGAYIVDTSPVNTMV